jgi:AcrR family transcriptional regulator
MRYKPDQRQTTRAGLVRAAGEVFRAQGFSGVGVDRLSSAAGLTSGAFYKHFTSKAALFEEVVRKGMERLGARLRPGSKDAAAAPTVDDYITLSLSAEHRAAPDRGCALPTLTTEVARSGAETRAVYQEGVLAAAAAMARLQPLAGRPDADETALAILALVSGGVAMTRAMADPDQADRGAEAIRRAASHLAHTGVAGAKPATGAKWFPAA